MSGGNAQNVTERTGDLDPATDGYGIGNISSFGEDARGEIYVVDYGTGGFDGEIFKIVPCRPVRRALICVVARSTHLCG